MRLYHTSTSIIEHPDIYRGRKNADFGQGFYMSPDIDFSRRWAVKGSYINEYELDTEELEIIFLSRNAEWFEHILKNRRLEDKLTADVVIGPIANDTLFDTFGIISSGYLSTTEALSLLMIGPEYTQMVIKTPKALGHLTWITADTVSEDLVLAEKIRTERDEYALAFAKAMEKLQS